MVLLAAIASGCATIYCFGYLMGRRNVQRPISRIRAEMKYPQLNQRLEWPPIID